MELEIMIWLQSFANGFLDSLFLGVTQLGEEIVYIAILTYIYWNVDKEFGKTLGFATIVSLVLNNGMKDFFSYERPIGQPGIRSLRIETATGKAFPSGHTMSASTFYTVLRMKVNKKWFGFACSVLILLVGVSRVYLGLHYPKDVLAGWILGILIAVFIYFGMEAVKQPIWAYLGAVVLGMVLLPFAESEDFYKMFGLLLGFVLGVIVESLYVEFENEATLKTKLIRFVIGLVILIVLKEGVKLILPDTHYAHMFRYLLVALVGFGGYPFMMKKLNL